MNCSGLRVVSGWSAGVEAKDDGLSVSLCYPNRAAI